MTDRIIHICAHGVLGLDVGVGDAPGQEALPEPSHDLLARAHAGWERFLRAAQRAAPHDV
ncbi:MULTISPECIES: hypothetical protein [unclassified Streptomyces]|uniref:hypothetical protein n=1 Tax=Streptomyces sp. NRRL F-4428 TaxID=1609137 RepID=UPI0005EC9492|nr:hypothetical protein [Streptomyces sp. NRRL F-4428]KJK44566.1 hypothetical protein UK14_28345 [Streptomyces sp. NRRL F-4428]